MRSNFYPTYEALKPFWMKSLQSRETCIFTLPMRHWNDVVNNPNHREAIIIFTLPMRHWNIVLYVRQWWQAIIFTLPMRHWNNSISSSLPVSSPIFTLPMRHWNQCLFANLSDHKHHFYPTYEALKLFLTVHFVHEIFAIFTLPMRHWNFLTVLVQVGLNSIFTLPMRHWNLFKEVCHGGRC